MTTVSPVPTSTRRADVAPAPRWLTALGWIAPIAFVAAQAAALLTSPPDKDMGDLQKILYVHVPAAWMAFLAFLALFVSSVLYLWKRDDRHDLVAASSAEAAAVLTGLTLALGSVGYLSLRAFTEDPDRRARWSAAVGILGALNVPIVYMSVKWWRTLHQVQSAPSTMDPTYVRGLRTNAFAFLFFLIWFIGMRYRAMRLERLAEQRQEEMELGAAPGGGA